MERICVELHHAAALSAPPVHTLAPGMIRHTGPVLYPSLEPSHQHTVAAPPRHTHVVALAPQSCGQTLRVPQCAAEYTQPQLEAQLPHTHARRRLPLHRGILRRAGTAARAVCRALRRTAAFVARHIQPQGPGHNDTTLTERVLNLLTCAPFATAGLTVLRRCHNAATRRFGRLFLLVGATATAYHASTGPARLLLRVCDYWFIAYTSCAMRACVFQPTQPPPSLNHPYNPEHSSKRSTSGSVRKHVLRAAQRCLATGALAAIPFAPSLVSTANFVLVEGRCLWLACRSRELMGPWVGHAVCSGVAACVFVGEDVLADKGVETHGMHAAWHVLSAMGIVTATPFLAHIEGQCGAQSVCAPLPLPAP